MTGREEKNFWEETDGAGNLAVAIEFKEFGDRPHHYRVYVRPAGMANSYEVGRCRSDGSWSVLPDRGDHVRPYRTWLEEAMGRLGDMALVHRVMES
jgi:hypothetical protein